MDLLIELYHSTVLVFFVHHKNESVLVIKQNVAHEVLLVNHSMHTEHIQYFFGVIVCDFADFDCLFVFAENLNIVSAFYLLLIDTYLSACEWNQIKRLEVVFKVPKYFGRRLLMACSQTSLLFSNCDLSLDDVEDKNCSGCFAVLVVSW